MKKFLLSILVGFLSFLGLTLGVHAASAPSTFITGAVVKFPEIIPGLVAYYKPLSNGVEVYCEDAGKTYVTGLTYTLKEPVKDGYIYIFEHRPNTGNTYVDYYLQSIAMWWYKDYLTNSNDNISYEHKAYIYNHRNDNAYCKIVYELVAGAIQYKQVPATIIFSDDNVTFTENNGYLVSNKITMTSTGVTNGGKLTVNNAPNGTKIINSTIDKTGNGTFQIQVPKSSIQNGNTYNFTINASVSYTIKSMYDYYVKVKPNPAKDYQQVIYGKIYSETKIVSVSKNVSLKINDVNELIINKVDEKGNYLEGANLVLYKGDCTNSTCSNVYNAWITGNNAKVFDNIPVGTYTLVEIKAPNGYLVANKQVINITSANGTYTAKMVDVKVHNKLTITKVDENNNNLSGAELVLYKGDCTNSTCSNVYSTWTTGNSAKDFTDIPVGIYTLVEIKAPNGYRLASKMLINIDSNNKTYAYKMVDQKQTSIRISKTDLTGQDEVPGATLVLNKVNGELVESWVSGNTPHFVTLDPGEYTLLETVAPKGYVLSSDTITFKIGLNNRLYQKEDNIWVQVDYIKMVNVPEIKEYKVRISKTDLTGQNEIPGATLVLKNNNGGLVESWVSDNTAHYVTLKPGEYFLTETVAPKGYVLSTDTINFKVDENGTIYAKNNNEWVKVDYIKMINELEEKEYKVRISKTNVTGDAEVPGASLVLKDSNSKEVASWVSTNAPHYETLKPGVYTLTETIAPKGYILSHSSITFKVDADGKIFTQNSTNEWVKVDYIKMVNLAKEAININKLDSETNEYVVGAVLQIKNNKGEIIATYTTGNESYYISLEEGVYTLEEVSAPKGYIINNKPVYFKVDADANIYVVNDKGEYIPSNGVIMYNEPEKIEIPATGLTSTFTYVIGTLILGAGAIMLYRNEKKC